VRNWLTPLHSSIVAGSYNESVTRRSFVSHFLDLCLPTTRRAPGYRAAVDPITRATVRSGDAIRQYRETGPPYPVLADARSAHLVHPLIRKGAFANRRDTEQRCA
jgi:hypothetical protein